MITPSSPALEVLDDGMWGLGLPWTPGSCPWAAPAAKGGMGTGRKPKIPGIFIRLEAGMVLGSGDVSVGSQNGLG